jgi:hypothetical protein
MFKRKITLFIAVGTIVTFIGGIYVCALFLATVIPDAPWHIEGYVLDSKTNGISGVNITISTMKKVTGFNQIVGTSPERENINGTTDTNGWFAFNVRAADLGIVFTKGGFREQSVRFQYIGGHRDNTNQNLRIVLTPE